MARLDPHSYNDSTQPQISHLAWRAKVDFSSRTLKGEATLTFAAPGTGPLDLDTRDLVIEGVFGDGGKPLQHELFKPEPILGSRLHVELPANTKAVTITYATSPEASALQWLTPAQTSGGKHPFLFSQCQAIHARSVVPLQDSPRVRIRYTAELTVPAELRALMAASFVSRNVNGAWAMERYEMPQAIPPYLLALAVGQLASKDLGPRSRVWAEPAVLEKAAWEFAEVDSMLTSAEKLLGPYRWDRFDLLTMPQSFPYGGMENPRLTFVTPTLLAGDRSLVNVVAHELAHSWTGNLVTNANADHFWLNEGWTVFAERRIQEALEGAEVAGLHAALGRRQLEKTIEGFVDRPELTLLRTHYEGIDPDDAYSLVPYEKGYLFLRTLEESVGKKAFDPFLRKYVDAFAFQSITTEQFIDFVEKELPGALKKINSQAWLHEPGLPGNAPAPRSVRLEELQKLGARLPEEAQGKKWTPAEWSLCLESMPRPAKAADLEKLDARFKLTGRGNYEVLISWLALAVESGYQPVLGRVEQVLGEVGRMKYLKPLYTALAKSESTRALARRCFDKYRDGYHPIARGGLEAILKKNAA